MIKQIFGKNIKFKITDNRVKTILFDELNLYKSSTTNNIDAEIYFVPEMINIKEQYISPNIHITTKNGFLTEYGRCKILYIKETILKIYVKIHNSYFVRKFLSLDYKTTIEVVGTILHELVLIPMTFFFHDLAIIHASSFKDKKSKTSYMIGGAGGVGKTSLELLYCKKNNFSFISDDIAIIDDKGNIYPNLSYPKIYAYNVTNDSCFKKEVLSDDSLIGKIQWNFMKKVRGDNKVRRRLSPSKLYKNYETEKCLADNYYILTKNNLINNITKQHISVQDAVTATTNIVFNEYHTFFQHIKWHEYNCIINNTTPTLNFGDIFYRSTEILTKCFRGTNNNVLKIPKKISHKDFIENISDLITPA